MPLSLASLKGEAQPEPQATRVYVKDGELCVKWPDGTETTTNLVHIQGSAWVTVDGIETFDNVTAGGERTHPH